MKMNEKIRANRNRLQLTQKQLANKLCLSAYAISSWERVINVPKADMLKDLADFFSLHHI